MIYDLVIIGGGPSGLSLAQKCCKSKKILIIDKENDIGGCHRVRRILNNLFTEHGPRVYSSAYITFISLLKEMNIDFYDLFTKSEFSIINIGGETIFSTLSYIELLQLTFQFILLIFNENHGQNINLGKYIVNFKESSKEMIDRICKLTDGGGIDKFTLNEFLQLFNQTFFYSLYQPKLPNDIGLFKLWKKYLASNNVEFLLNSYISQINIKKNMIESLNINDKIIYGKEFVFAIPPPNLNDLIIKNNIKHNWGDLTKFASYTEYITYIPITFHWNTKLNLKKIYGFPRSEWGIAFVVLTDYMVLQEQDSKTVISTAITITNSPNIHGKTANQSSKQELIQHVFDILKSVYTNLPKPTSSIVSPGVIYENNEYKSLDTAFINTAITKYLPFQNSIIPNMYNLGTHNGYSLYKFTSLESAVSNGVILSNIICNTKNKIILKKGYTISNTFRLLIILLIAIYYINK